MKLYKITLSILLLLTVFVLFKSDADATQLPQPVVDCIKKTFPGSEIRFDGLVELKDKTIYLPVMPLVYQNTDNPAKIVQTIPAKSDFSKKPDMVLFEDNLALFKLVQDENGDLTVNYSSEIPLNVKLGILPQDLIVPHGLVLPTELRIIMGDLKILVKAKKDEDDLVFYGSSAEDNTKNAGIIKGKIGEEKINVLPELQFLKNKALYSASFSDNTIDIIDSQTGRTKKSMKLPSHPSNLSLTPDERYILIPMMSLNKILVVDTFSNIFLKEIPVGKYPSSILMSQGPNKAYVANRFSQSISEIDLANMVVSKDINVAGNPDNLVFSPDNKNIYYIDKQSGYIYCLNLEKQTCVNILQAVNVSKFDIKDGKLFVLNRGSNELVVFNAEDKKEIARVKVGEKPVDMQISEKRDEIYVLCADSDEIYVLNLKDYKIKNNISLNTNGFPGKITLIEKENRALITNYSAYQITVFDTEKQQVTGSIPVIKPISYLQVSR